jgi:hypothetical protein
MENQIVIQSPDGTFRAYIAMSALPLKADSRPQSQNVR